MWDCARVKLAAGCLHILENRRWYHMLLTLNVFLSLLLMPNTFRPGRGRVKLVAGGPNIPESSPPNHHIHCQDPCAAVKSICTFIGRGRVKLVAGGPDILETSPPGQRAAARSVLSGKGVSVVTNGMVSGLFAFDLQRFSRLEKAAMIVVSTSHFIVDIRERQCRVLF